MSRGWQALGSERQGALLADVGQRVALAIDAAGVVSEACDAAVPAFADACAIDVLQPDGLLRRVGAAHVDPALGRLLQRLSPSPESDVAQVIRTGRSRLVAPVTEEHVVRASRTDSELALRRALAATSMLIVRLEARARPLGALSFTTRGERPPFTNEELAVAEEYARVVGLAYENVRLWDAEREARALLDALFEHAPVGFALFAPDLRARRVNQALAELLGETREAQVGRPAYELLPGDRREVEERLHGVLGRRRPDVGWELRSGGRVWEASLYPVPSASGALLGVGAVLVEVTEQRRARRAIEHSEALMRVMVDVGAALEVELGFAERLARLLLAAVPSYADYAVADICDEHGSLRRAAVAAPDALIEEELRAFPVGAPGSPEARALELGEPVLIAGTAPADLVLGALDEPEAARWARLHLRSALAVPLHARGRSIGVLTFATSEARSNRQYGAADLQFARLLALRAALALDNARLYDAEREARRYVETLQAVTAALTAAPGPEEVARGVLAAGLPALGATAGAVYGLDPAGGSLVLIEQSGYARRRMRGLERLSLAIATPLTDAVQRREPVWIDDRRELAAAYPHAFDRGAGGPVGSLGAVPFLIGDRILGGIAISRTEERPFGDVERALLQALAGQCAQALDRTRLYAAEREARRDAEAAATRLAALQAATVRVAHALTSEDVVRVLVDEISAVLRPDHAWGGVYDEHGALRVAHRVGDPETVPEAVRRPDAAAIGGARPVAWRGGEGVVTVALRQGDELRAAAGFASAGRRRFGAAERELVEALAVLCGQAIARAQRYVVERQISLTLQRGLLPARLPTLDGVRLAGRYLPASESGHAGGDWYDAIALPRGLGLVLGDAAGHGPQAAGLMAQLRSALHAFAVSGERPDRVLARLAAFAPVLAAESFATVAYGALNPATRVLTYVCAGHPPPVLLDGAGARLLDDAVGPPLGAPDPRYRAASRVLEPGSRLILYSDGLIERRARSIDEGLAELLAAVQEAAAAPTPAALAEAVLARCLPARHGDDVALLVADVV